MLIQQIGSPGAVRLRFGPFELNAAERSLCKANQIIPLGGRAYDILIALLENAGEWRVGYKGKLDLAAGESSGTTNGIQSICTSPDPVCTLNSGPPPRTLPRTDLCSWRASPCNVMVTGWSTITLPEPVEAPMSNAACSGSLS